MGMAGAHLVLQVLKTNAMYGRSEKAPMEKKEMMELAKDVLLKGGEFKNGEMMKS